MCQAATATDTRNADRSALSFCSEVDFGLTHLVALSLNGYNGVDLCTDECNKAQVEWCADPNSPARHLGWVAWTKTPAPSTTRFPHALA